jgi:hypothetical protein
MHENHPDRPSGETESAVRARENRDGAVVPERLQELTGTPDGTGGSPEIEKRDQTSPLDRNWVDLGDTTLVVTPEEDGEET